MHDLVVIVGRSAKVTRDVMPDEENPESLETLFPECLRVGTSFGGQFYVVSLVSGASTVARWPVMRTA
jgi:hypothetical protein